MKTNEATIKRSGKKDIWRENYSQTVEKWRQEETQQQQCKQQWMMLWQTIWQKTKIYRRVQKKKKKKKLGATIQK